MAAFIQSYFSYAQLAMVFVVTTILHAKFTNPRSATGYLSLPGTSLEKYIVMLVDYALASLAVFALWIVLHYLTMAVCWMVSPEISWNVNPLQFLTPVRSMDDLVMKMEGVIYRDNDTGWFGVRNARVLRWLHGHLAHIIMVDSNYQLGSVLRIYLR